MVQLNICKPMWRFPDFQLYKRIIRNIFQYFNISSALNNGSRLPASLNWRVFRSFIHLGSNAPLIMHGVMNSISPLPFQNITANEMLTTGLAGYLYYIMISFCFLKSTLPNILKCFVSEGESEYRQYCQCEPPCMCKEQSRLRSYKQAFSVLRNLESSLLGHPILPLQDDGESSHDAYTNVEIGCERTVIRWKCLWSLCMRSLHPDNLLRCFFSLMNKIVRWMPSQVRNNEKNWNLYKIGKGTPMKSQQQREYLFFQSVPLNFWRNVIGLVIGTKAVR